MKLADNVYVDDKVNIRRGSDSNVRIKKIDPRTGEVVEERLTHNIFVNYGRDWIAHIIGLQDPDTPFRTDRIKYTALGVGGEQQTVSSTNMRDTTQYNYPDYPNSWGGGGGSGDPSQTHTDPTVTALEWPVEITSGVYYDLISQDHTFPDTGIIRLTSVIGVDEVSFGTWTSVPLSEIGLFTQWIDDATVGTGEPPVVWGGQATSDKGMIAYNQFPTLHKTDGFVLQIDWELRFR